MPLAHTLLVSGMAFGRYNALVVASLLAVAALVCLLVGTQLLLAGGDGLLFDKTASETRLVAALAIIGGLVVFLLGTVALLGARRYALAWPQHHEPAPAELDLIDIRAWGQELAHIRDDLRHDLEAVDAQTEVLFQTWEVPASWRPKNQYLLGDDGQPRDPLADLKQTRDHLMSAAERVDAIVQNINDFTQFCDDQATAGNRRRNWTHWWNYLRIR